MPKKSFNISEENWKKIRNIKDRLNKDCEKILTWEETFNHIIEFYEKGGGFCEDIKEINEIAKINADLSIPPLPSKKKFEIEINSNELKEMVKKETPTTKYILINCDICKKNPILMPVPKKIIQEANEPVVEVSFVHGIPEHVLVAQLDHDFQVRRRRSSQVVYERDYKLD